MNYQEKYGSLLERVADEADRIAMHYFRGGELKAERKQDGTVVTMADKMVEKMAREMVAASGLPMDVLGEEMGGESLQGPAMSGRARMIIDPIDGTEEFSRGIPTFGTLMGIEEGEEIVAGMVSAPHFRRGPVGKRTGEKERFGECSVYRFPRWPDWRMHLFSPPAPAQERI